MTDGKRGVLRAHVSLTDATGETRYALTNHLGYYHFADVPAGATYILSASSNQHVFAPPVQVLFVGEEITNANFTAQIRLAGF